MSLIVALTTPGNVIMGADSGSYDLDNGIRQQIGNHKIFRQSRGGLTREDGALYFMVGCVGSVRQRQVFRYLFVPPIAEEDTSLTQYMVTQYVPALYDALDQEHALGAEEPLEGSALIAVYGTGRLNNRPHVYELQATMQVCEHTGDWNAIGASYQIALSVLDTLHGRGLTDDDPAAAVQQALHVTERYSLFCTSPFYIEQLIKD